MDEVEIREYCLAKPHSTESMPFGSRHLVFKVGGKIFLILALDETPLRFNVKCAPEDAVRLRDEFPNVVLPGYHMNKKHWNTILCTGKMNRSILREMIDESYRLVCPASLRK